MTSFRLYLGKKKIGFKHSLTPPLPGGLATRCCIPLALMKLKGTKDKKIYIFTNIQLEQKKKVTQSFDRVSEFFFFKRTVNLHIQKTNKQKIQIDCCV